MAHVGCGPGTPLAKFNNGAGKGRFLTKVHVLYPKKSQLQNLFVQKQIPFFLAYPPKYPCGFASANFIIHLHLNMYAAFSSAFHAYAYL